MTTTNSVCVFTSREAKGHAVHSRQQADRAKSVVGVLRSGNWLRVVSSLLETIDGRSRPGCNGVTRPNNLRREPTRVPREVVLGRVLECEPSALASGPDASSVEERRPAASVVGSEDA